VIAVPVAATDIVAAPASPASTTEPLAIAAAAIATSTSTVEASKTASPTAAQGLGDQPKPASAPAIQVTTRSETTPIAGTPAAAAVTDGRSHPLRLVSSTHRRLRLTAVTTPVSQPIAKADAATQASPGTDCQPSLPPTPVPAYRAEGNA